MSQPTRHRSRLADHPGVAPVLPQYVARLPGQVATLRALWQSGQREELRRIAHQLKGSGNSFGFAPLSDLAQRLEDLLRQPAVEAPADAAIDAALQALIAYIEQIEGYQQT